jgi:hypothetical protein
MSEDSEKRILSQFERIMLYTMLALCILYIGYMIGILVSDGNSVSIGTSSDSSHVIINQSK